MQCRRDRYLDSRAADSNHWHARFFWRAVTTARGPQRVSVTSAGENVSDGEGVGVMLFLMRYQIVIATRREINFARQFSSVSLVHRTETNIARQFFEVCPFIIAVQQSFRDALTKRLQTKIALNSPPMANGNPGPALFEMAKRGLRVF